jgi:hypothetical protein
LTNIGFILDGTDVDGIDVELDINDEKIKVKLLSGNSIFQTFDLE